MRSRLAGRLAFLYADALLFKRKTRGEGVVLCRHQCAREESVFGDLCRPMHASSLHAFVLGVPGINTSQRNRRLEHTQKNDQRQHGGGGGTGYLVSPSNVLNTWMVSDKTRHDFRLLS